MPRDVGGGVMADTVADILGDTEDERPVERVEAPRLPSRTAESFRRKRHRGSPRR